MKWIAFDACSQRGGSEKLQVEMSVVPDQYGSAAIGLLYRSTNNFEYLWQRLFFVQRETKWVIDIDFIDLH